MGTRFEVVVGGDDEVHLRTAAEAALDEIALWDERLSLFRRDSLLSHINRSAANKPVRLDPDTFALFAACRQVSLASQGAFDPTVAPLMTRFGLHPDRSDSIAEPLIGMQHVILDDSARSIQFTSTEVALDLGGIAKGHALDLAAACLREANVSTALIHGGTSSIITIGSPPGCDGWPIRIAHIDEPLTVELRDVAMSISSPAGRMVDTEGESHGHIIDPRHGAPSRSASLAATIGPSARDADAWSTALLVLGALPTALPAELTAMVFSGDRRLIGGPLASTLLRKSDTPPTEPEPCLTSTVAPS